MIRFFSQNQIKFYKVAQYSSEQGNLTYSGKDNAADALFEGFVDPGASVM